MKSRKMKVILVIVIVLLVIGGAALINFSPMFLMKPVETGQIKDTNIMAVKNGINSLYLLKGDDGWIVIDAGTDKEKVRLGLAILDIDPADVSHLFMTHSDYDHVGAMDLFKNAQIYIGEDEKQMTDGSVKRNLFQRNQFPAGVDQENISYLSDGEEVLAGGITVKTFKTPGHTRGSVSYLAGQQYLFTGDAFRVKDMTMMVHPFTMDKKTAEQSIEHIKSVKDQSVKVFTAHYGGFEAADLK